jgi:hypothetical protein
MKAAARDHMSPEARTVAARAKVKVVEQPDWTLELLTVLCLLLVIALASTYVQLTLEIERHAAAREERDFWREFAVAPETNPTATVRLVRAGDGFRCEHFNVRREWELAVAVECKVLAGLLTLARATP